MEQTRYVQEILKNRRMLFAFILSIVRDRNAAEDLFQETALIAFEKFAEYRPDTDFGAWVRAIARHRILKWREKSSRLPVLLDGEAIEAVSDAHSRMPERVWPERDAALKQCLEDLSPRSRELVELRYRVNQDFDAIGRQLGYTANSVQMTLSKIRKSLRRCIEFRLASALRG